MPSCYLFVQELVKKQKKTFYISKIYPFYCDHELDILHVYTQRMQCDQFNTARL